MLEAKGLVTPFSNLSLIDTLAPSLSKVCCHLANTLSSLEASPLIVSKN
jgi:hypothetical protein